MKKAAGPGYQALLWRMEDVLAELVADFKAAKPLHWPVLPRRVVHRVWSGFVRDGYVRDDRALDNIQAAMRDNVVRLQIANIVAGHEALDPGAILEEHLPEEQYEDFCAWLIESEQGWRISDYGLAPLQDALALAHEAKTSAARLKYLDRALHVTHQRGDLSRLFIEGGRSTVADLDEFAGTALHTA
jgi:hypothetical protein